MEKKPTVSDNKASAPPSSGNVAKKQVAAAMDGSVFVGPPQPQRIVVKTTTTTATTANVVGSVFVGIVSSTEAPSTSPAPVSAPTPPALVPAPTPPPTAPVSAPTPPPPAFGDASIIGYPSAAKSVCAASTMGSESTSYSIIQGPSFAINATQIRTILSGTGVKTATVVGDQQKKSVTSAKSASATKSVGGSPKATKIVENVVVDPKIMTKIEEGYVALQSSTDCKSLLKKYLTKDVLDKLKAKKTSFGSTLWDVIQSGVKNLDSGVGVYAPDAEAYRTFSDLFEPILADYHGFKADQKQPAVDLGEAKVGELSDLDPENKFIVSTRIRCGRSIQGYPFNPCLTEENYKEMEQKMITLFGGIKDPDLQGTYYPLTGMTKEVQNELIKDHFLFKEGDRFLREANACRFWPTGRGIFLNQKKTFLVWVNEEDHLRIISMQPGGHVGQVLQRLIKGLKIIESQMPFSRDDRYGWLTFCPTNLGTTVRASVHIKLPKISKLPDFKSICDTMKLQIRGIHGEHSETEGGVYDISNKVRLGFSEYAVVKQMYDGVKKLIEMEKTAL